MMTHACSFKVFYQNNLTDRPSEDGHAYIFLSIIWRTHLQMHTDCHMHVLESFKCITCGRQKRVSGGFLDFVRHFKPGLEMGRGGNIPVSNSVSNM